MWSPPQKPVGVGVVKQQWQQQQSEQPRRTPSFEKSSVSHYFEGWNAGSLSLPSGSGLRPPHAPSPQPSPKTQLSPSNPFESRRPLRLGEYPQGNLRLPTNTNDDDDFFALAKPETNHEFALSRTPTIESVYGGLVDCRSSITKHVQITPCTDQTSTSTGFHSSSRTITTPSCTYSDSFLQRKRFVFRSQQFCLLPQKRAHE